MRVVHKVSVAAVFASVVLAFSFGAQAQDHWDRDHYDHHDDRRDDRHVDHHDYRPQRFVEERPVYIAPRPPVVVAPPVYAAPAGPPSLNLNFNVPL